MAWKIKKVGRLHLGKWYFPDRIPIHDSRVPVNQESAHIIAHKGKAGTVNAPMGFPAPPVLDAQIRFGIIYNGSSKPPLSQQPVFVLG